MGYDLQIKHIGLNETYVVRHPVLREGKPISSCAFEGDDLDSTIHIGAFHHNDLIAVTTFMKNGHQIHLFKNAYQLRGMAVIQNYQGKGVGKILLNFGETSLVEKQVSILWMNAREKAVPFYKKLGFKVIGNVFDIPEIGNHYVMFKKLKQVK